MNAMGNDRPTSIRPLQVVLIILVSATVAGSCWLLSAAESTRLVDGAVEWSQESPLRAVVQLLCLNYRWPTVYAGEVKIYVLGIGAGLATLALGIAILARSRGPKGVANPISESETTGNPEGRADVSGRPKFHMEPLRAAQVLAVLYLVWSFASSRESAAPELAIGGSILLTTHFLWCFAIGNGLNAAAARIVCRFVVAVTAITACIAVWYYHGRNPNLRAKFPFGNPLFLSACLIPGMVVAFAFVCERIQHIVQQRRLRTLVPALLGLGAIVLAGWAFYLTRSRGPALGLAMGLLAVAFFALRGWRKWLPVLIATAALAFAFSYFVSSRDEASLTGRSATVRFRLYAWDYAWRMFAAKPLTGHGQGGFVLAGDAFAAGDVEYDPEVLGTRIAHAHNEWLEVMADLGSVGIVLLVATLVLTLHAGMLALRSPRPIGERWALIGAMGALVGLMVESTFGVGLRVDGVPTLYYTMIGLIWALAAHGSDDLTRVLSERPGWRLITGIIASVLGLGALVVTQQDFDAARSGFQASELIDAGRFEEAIPAAAAARSRLNPQRALTNLYRLSEAHMLVAKSLQQRAADREQRAAESDIVDVRLFDLAAQDRAEIDLYCQQGSMVLKELVTKSPGALNHGWVLYWLNRILAANANAREQTELRDQYLLDAVAALDRELLRQPFNQEITVEYLRMAGPSLDPQRFLNLLARPLRYDRATVPYWEFLAESATEPSFEERFDPVVQVAGQTLASEPTAERFTLLADTWTPEKLRLAATFRFRRGDYERAALILEQAARIYTALDETPAIAAASCLAELADSRFFSRPNEPARAIEAAERAAELAPPSLVGRQLTANLRQRKIDYLLAADREEEAVILLRETAPPHASEADVLLELGARYRRLCDSLLRRRLALELRQSPDALLGKLDRWIKRALELNPRDGAAHYLAADLALYQGACTDAADQLRQALLNEFPIDVAIRFLAVALDKSPDCDALSVLSAQLERIRAESSPSEPDARTDLPSVLP